MLTAHSIPSTHGSLLCTVCWPGSPHHSASRTCASVTHEGYLGCMWFQVLAKSNPQCSTGQTSPLPQASPAPQASPSHSGLPSLATQPGNLVSAPAPILQGSPPPGTPTTQLCLIASHLDILRPSEPVSGFRPPAHCRGATRMHVPKHPAHGFQPCWVSLQGLPLPTEIRPALMLNQPL